MTENTEFISSQPSCSESPQEQETCCAIQFRPGEQIFSAVSRFPDIKTGDLVMVQSEHGLEPARVHGIVRPCPGHREPEKLGSHFLVRRASRDEGEKFARLRQREEEAFAFCVRLIATHALPMKLIRVERYFNGGKIIFYFTADTRVDFRDLVKDLVQEFRTRVEIRQVGVRHETKMIGGLGCCGRELCCSSYLKNFAPVSIKMAKEQGLPLNPAKISGICNRLLCCLTYEYETYHSQRKKMPRQGKIITIGEKNYKIVKVNALEETLEVSSVDGQERNVLLGRDEWSRARLVQASGTKPQESGESTGESDLSAAPRRKKPRRHNSSGIPEK